MKTANKKNENNGLTMPYVNLDCPELKKELNKIDVLIKNLKHPLPFK